MTNNKKERFWEIDFLRGIAIIMMIIYHILYSLNFFDIVKINLYSTPFRLFLYPIGTTFLLLVGISLTLSFFRSKHFLSKKELYLKFLKRGLMIFLLGLIITIFTWLFLERGFIIFGVLHCIGICIIISIPFLNLKYINLFLGIILVFIGIILRTMVFDFSYFLWLGFIPKGFYTIDYFPLLPWFGVVLIGIFFGNILYKNHKRAFRINDFSKNMFVNSICFLGKKSLVIYFVHQPIIIIFLYLFFLS